MNELSNFITVTLVLIIVGLYLRNWEPPIKKQYVSAALFLLGMVLGLTMLDSWACGLVLAGVVFFKDALVDEIKLVRDSVSKIEEENKGE